MSTMIIGIDPGDSTGLAALLDGKLIAATQTDPMETMIGLELLLKRGADEGHRVVIAIERFVNSSNIRSHEPTAQQVVGAVTAKANEAGVQLVLQGPSDARTMADAARKLKLRRSARDVDKGDANDVNMAINHALLAMMHLEPARFSQLVGIGS
jgi:hypothetical protein